MSECVPKGIGLTRKSERHYGSNTLAIGGFLDDSIQTHTHNYYRPSISNHKLTIQTTGGSYIESTANGTSGSPSGSTRDTTEVKSIMVYYMIKAF